MSNDKIFRIDWYPAQAFTDYSRMTAEEIAVISQIINLIYMNQGAIENDPKWICRSIRNMGSAKCKNIIKNLINNGEIFLQNDGKINKKRCQNELKTTAKRRQNASVFGKEGAKMRWENEENQQHSDSHPIKTEMASISISTNTNTNTSISTEENDANLFSEKELKQFRKNCPSLTEEEFKQQTILFETWVKIHGAKTPEVTFIRWLQRAEKDVGVNKKILSAKKTQQEEDRELQNRILKG